ncbi:Uncharacterised protein [Mycobacteroides abscessus subsp. abscessus]|nr:Uncharacterised protein [Mycobacteroides abscessus subsp. abscessus]
MLSVKTTNAGTFISLAVLSRQSFSATSSSSSISDGQLSQRRSSTAAGVLSAALQTRQRAPPPRRLGVAEAGSCAVGAIPLRNRECLRDLRPPAALFLHRLDITGARKCMRDG